MEARHWFEQAAQTLPDAQYALGKLLLTDDPEVHNRDQGLHWLEQAAENGHDYAAYRLGKEFLKEGKTDKALPWLKTAVEADNPYAEYLLGKLLWEGADMPQDKEQALYWLGQTAEQGHTHAQLLLEWQGSSSLPSTILAVNGLLHQMGTFSRTTPKPWTAPAASTQITSYGGKFRRRKSLWGTSWTIMRSRAMLVRPCERSRLAPQ